MDLVTVQEAQQHIRIDTDADTPWLNVMIPAVSEGVRSWLKDEWRLYVLARDEAGAVVRDENGTPVPAVDEQGNRTVRPIIKSASLVELAQQYRFRDGDGAPAVPSHAGHGYVLGQGATALLASSRRSTVA